MSNKICVISSNYPQRRFPERGAFVESLVSRWEEMGVIVDVIAPQSIPDILRSFGRDSVRERFAGNKIVRPIYLSVSNKKIGPVDLQAISRGQLAKTVLREVEKLKKPDLFYGKFFMSGAYAALAAGKKYNRPVIADLGESRLLEAMDEKELDFAKGIVPEFDGFACVSQRLVDEVIELGANPVSVLYAPNTVDVDRFRPMDKEACRAELDLPMDDFIVAFVGHFIERKGPLRVLKAINSLNKDVKGIFMGRGGQKPEGDKVLHAGSVPNKYLPVWLNAADVFVLPTLAEGNCNAINEALACGLPVISSDIPDIRSQVPANTGILVDPLNPRKIAGAIAALKNEANLLKYRDQCLKLANKRFSSDRGKHILEWIKNDIYNK